MPNPHAFMIVQTDASDKGFGGILKQRLEPNPEHLVRFHSGTWTGPQVRYSTIKKEVLAIVLCISKFQGDLHFKKFLLRIDSKSAKEVSQKDIPNLISQQTFACWQEILSVFDFDIEFINGKKNSLPDFLSREVFQAK